ncbi:MAG: hypothetical protein NTV05_01075 [Acidobacteria bacterium]|nr:hypothetical protein [Acidobacteriota bacterium]
MHSFLGGAFLVFVDIIGMVGAAALASWVANRSLPMFVKGGIGAVCGIAVELARTGVVYLLVGGMFGESPEMSDVLGWLAAFRLWNIPILVGVGFMAGSFAGQSAIRCPACGNPVTIDTTPVGDTSTQGLSLASSNQDAGTYRQDCPHCNASLIIDPQTRTAVGHEPVETDGEAPEPEAPQQKIAPPAE